MHMTKWKKGRKARVGATAPGFVHISTRLMRRERRNLRTEDTSLRSAKYLMSSLFLREAYQDLVRDAAEDMQFVTGPESEDYRVLSRFVVFEKNTRTAVRVTGDPQSSHRVLIALSQSGHRLLAWMHSHPGVGANATCPSGTDLAHQARLERGGYPTIGLITSRDGYVRFFSKDLPFTVHITGGDVRRIDERIYQLDLE
jgi:proteasome lid subunit RPN8/RPN11